MGSMFHVFKLVSDQMPRSFYMASPRAYYYTAFSPFWGTCCPPPKKKFNFPLGQTTHPLLPTFYKPGRCNYLQAGKFKFPTMTIPK